MNKLIKKKPAPVAQPSTAELQKMADDLREMQAKGAGDFSDQIATIEDKIKIAQKPEGKLSPLDIVRLARNPGRPIFYDYINLIFTEFTELHGDRRFSDDHGLAGGFARLGGKTPVMVIGHSRGKNVSENIDRNFGMAKPDGYRKALRLMRLAEKFNVPVVTLIDTAGAYPGLEAEERGQAEAIAFNLHEMARLSVPVICIVTGEGGSGGALGIGVGDVVCMLSNAIYSVISPEGCASILWRDASFAGTAAEAMKITAPELKELGVIDEIIPEPVGGAHTDQAATAKALKSVIEKHLKRLSTLTPAKLVAKRYEKFAAMGKFNIK